MNSDLASVANPLRRTLLYPVVRSEHAVAIAAVLAATFLGPRVSTVVVAAVYAVIAAGLLIRWPSCALPGLLLAAAFVPFALGTGTQSTVNIAIIAVGGLTALWLLRMGLHGDIRLNHSSANAAWQALILVSGISILAGDALWNPWVSTGSNFLVVQVAQWAIFVLSACAFWLTANFAPSRRVLRVLTVLVLALGAVLLARWLLPGSAVVTRHLLLTSTVFRIWVVAFAAGMALFHDSLDRRVRFLLFAMAVLFVVVARQYGSTWQSGWMPPLVTLGALSAIKGGRGLTRAALALSLPGLAAFATVILPRVAAAERWSFETRAIAWRGLLDLMHGKWLFGLGLASYWHYWRDVLGMMAYRDPETGYLHYTYEPKVNMHNNFVDIFGQMGLVGIVVVAWLVIALFLEVRRQFAAEPAGFGRAYTAACAGGLIGMLFAGMLADWTFPFVYNIGLSGFRDSFVGWMLLGGLVALDVTQGEDPAAASTSSGANTPTAA